MTVSKPSLFYMHMYDMHGTAQLSMYYTIVLADTNQTQAQVWQFWWLSRRVSEELTVISIRRNGLVILCRPRSVFRLLYFGSLGSISSVTHHPSLATRSDKIRKTVAEI